MQNVNHSNSQQPVHISSLVLKFWPLEKVNITAQLNEIENLDIYAMENSGKGIIVIEEKTEKALIHVIDRIRQIQGVIDASLVYHQFDDTDADNQK